jgi:predicted acetyltransferase
MNITLEKATEAEKPIFDRMMQLYIYDFTEFTGAEVQPDGTYASLPEYDDYWSHSLTHYPYLLKVDDKLAGFVLMKDNFGAYDHFLAQFFVMRKYRKQGVGSDAARKVFAERPGRWGLYQLENNVPAQRFWDKLLAEVAHGDVRIHWEGIRRYQSFQIMKCTP